MIDMQQDVRFHPKKERSRNWNFPSERVVLLITIAQSHNATCLYCADAQDDNFAIKITNKYVNCLICNLIVIIFIKRDDAMLRTMIINGFFCSFAALTLVVRIHSKRHHQSHYLWHGKRWWDNEVFFYKCLWYANLS